jgi:hypothetical protein
MTAANNLLAVAIEARVFHEKTTPERQSAFRSALSRRQGRKPSYRAGNATPAAEAGNRQDRYQRVDSEERSRFARLDIDPSALRSARTRHQ